MEVLQLLGRTSPPAPKVTEGQLGHRAAWRTGLCPMGGSLPEPMGGSLPEPMGGSLPEPMGGSLPEPMGGSLLEPGGGSCAADRRADRAAGWGAGSGACTGTPGWRPAVWEELHMSCDLTAPGTTRVLTNGRPAGGSTWRG